MQSVADQVGPIQSLMAAFTINVDQENFTSNLF